MAADVKYARYALREDKEFVVIRYKELVDSVQTAGKTAAELKAAVVVESGEEALPDIADVKYLSTRVCKVLVGEDAGKYALISILRYIG